MGRLVMQRVASLVPVLLGIVVATFFMVRLIPGDIVDVLLGENTDPRLAAQLRSFFGLDKSIGEQFVTWMGGLLHGDLGTSLRTGRPVLVEVLDHFPATLELALAALAISLAFALPLGILSATFRGRPIDVAARGASLLGLSIPDFFLGVLLIMVFSVQLRLLPTGGFQPLEDGLGDNLRFLVMPAFTLAAAFAATTARMTRSSLLEVIGQEYIRTARGKGLRERSIIGRHALRNALIPIVTIVGIQTGRLLGGTVVVEQVFSWPGLGSMVVRSITQRDYALLQGSVLFLALFFVLANLIVDVLYIYLDPRLRRG